MAEKIKVSIIIDTYNYARYMRKAIDSALSQDYQEGFEVIVVDDASTDETDTICKEYGRKIIYLRNENNIGGGAGVNRCLQIARGDYICVLDGDDAFLPGAISWYARTLDNFPCVGFVYGDIIRVNEIKGTRARHRSPDFDRGLLEQRNIVYCSTQMYRKSCLEAVGGYDETISYGDDYDIIFKVTEISCGLHVPRIIQERTLKENSLTSRVFREGSYHKWKRHILRKMKKRKLINKIKEFFRPSPLRQFENELEQSKMRQALRQSGFIIEEIFPKKVLVAEDGSGCLAAAFKEKGIETVKIAKEDLREVNKIKGDFDLVVLWHALETFPEEEVKKIIEEVLKNGPRTIVLLLETKEFYDNAFDTPTRPRAWWIDKFSPNYKVFEPRAKRPVINEDTWFYNYGLDKVMFFKK